MAAQSVLPCRLPVEPAPTLARVPEARAIDTWLL